MSGERHPFHKWIQLEQPRLGTRVTFATDEFFAAKERLIEPQEPVFIDDKYDDHGKWMDGWESRRKRTPGHDYCIVKLGLPGVIRGFDIVKTKRLTLAGLSLCPKRHCRAMPTTTLVWITIRPGRICD